MEIITGVERRRRWRAEDKLRIVAPARQLDTVVIEFAAPIVEKSLQSLPVFHCVTDGHGSRAAGRQFCELRFKADANGTVLSGMIRITGIDDHDRTECLRVQRGPATPAATSARMRGVVEAGLSEAAVGQEAYGR